LNSNSFQDSLAHSNLVKARLDYKFIRDNRDLVIQNLKDRKYTNLEPVVEEIISLFDKKQELGTQIQKLNIARKGLASSRNVEEGRNLRNQLQATEQELNQVQSFTVIYRNKKVEENLFVRTVKIPNISHKDVPRSEPRQLRLAGKLREFSFPIKDHLALGKSLDLIDFESAALATGTEISAKFLTFQVKNFTI
jgi:seryl-tRNA synthetase